ncbi:hypothetical protein P7H55_00205 [Vagococcus lutrae]|uniref:hypothetical protein n=1 Tax=Vagococcus lutrae TaxID=81947 RepID=UPI00288CDDBE|nr:hypothetical protein [Vagococcus lutrae]MDT2816277.1 hypothetical protein [Vagococcus lutrae]
MALTTNKAISLTGESKIDGKQVIYLSADIRKENAGNTSVTQSFSDQELYKTNLRECRKDVLDFQNLVWEIEDKILEESNMEENE